MQAKRRFGHFWWSYRATLTGEFHLQHAVFLLVFYSNHNA